MERPSKEVYESWIRHPVTQFYLTALQDKRDQIKEGVAQGAAGYNILGPEVQTYIGRCMGLQDALEYAVKEFEYADRGVVEDDN